MSSYPKYLNKVMLTKQELGGHWYTVLYDRQGNKYLKLEKFELKLPKPELIEDSVASSMLAHNLVLKQLMTPHKPLIRKDK